MTYKIAFYLLLNLYILQIFVKAGASLLAQLVERETVNLEANGSIPLRRAYSFWLFAARMAKNKFEVANY